MITILQDRSDTTLEGVELKNWLKSWREILIFLLSSPFENSIVFFCHSDVHRFLSS